MIWWFFAPLEILEIFKEAAKANYKCHKCLNPGRGGAEPG